MSVKAIPETAKEGGDVTLVWIGCYHLVESSLGDRKREVWYTGMLPLLPDH